MPIVPSGHLRPLEEHADGEHRSGPQSSIRRPSWAIFRTPNPLVTFSKDDIAFTYGSKWKQRYFTKIGDDYFVFPAQWDVRNKVWRQYYVRPGTDWWTSVYPADQMQRPTAPLCDGCHSVNFDIKTKAVTEWNVGCEKCHGAGSAHVARSDRGDHREPGQARRRAGRRRVHSMPLAGAAADQSRSKGGTTIGQSGISRATD